MARRSTLSRMARIWPASSLASLLVMLAAMTDLLTPHARPMWLLEETLLESVDMLESFRGKLDLP